MPDAIIIGGESTDVDETQAKDIGAIENELKHLENHDAENREAIEEVEAKVEEVEEKVEWTLQTQTQIYQAISDLETRIPEMVRETMNQVLETLEVVNENTPDETETVEADTELPKEAEIIDEPIQTTSRNPLSILIFGR